MKGTHILGLVTATLWAIALLMGFNSIDLMRSQHISGWPSAGNIHYFIYIPTALLALVVSAWVLAVRWRRIKVPAVIFILLALLVLPVYLLAYSGGI
jgi:hypothetical protein